MPESSSPGGRLLLVAPHDSYRILPYLEAARALGLDSLVASTGRHALTHGGGLHVDLHDPDAALGRLLEAHRRRPFAGVVATDDAAVELAARAARALGLPHNPPEAARCSRRKDIARARLAAAGLPVPEHRRLRLDRDPAAQLGSVGYPCVVKPLSLAGSRGVIRADDPAALRAACRRVAAIVASLPEAEGREYVLAERYVEGPEIAVEGLLRDGRLQVLAVFDKPEPMRGPFFEESYYVTPSRHPPALLERARERVAQACAAYGLREGPVHAELRLAGGEAWIVEVAARTIGGQCARLLRFGTGHGLEALVVAQAVGRPLPVQPLEGAAGVLMIPIPRAGVLRRVEGVLAAQKVPGVEDLVIQTRSGYRLVPLPEGSAYLGFVFARGPDPAAVEASLRRAHACLNVVVDPHWELAASA